MRRLLLASAIVAASAGAVSAGPVSFNFESLPTNTVTSLNYPVGAAVLNLSRSSGANFGFQDLTPFGRPVSWGTRTLSPFTANVSDQFNALFTAPGSVTSVSIEYGDYGQDSGNARFQVWSGAPGVSTLLSDQTQFWNGTIAGGSNGTFVYSGSNIGSISFWGEVGQFNNSLYWDNININYEDGQVIPLPSVAGMSLAGLAVIGIRRRRTA